MADRQDISPAEADRLYQEAPADPISDSEIDRLVAAATKRSIRMTIEEMQNAILAKGWQFCERIFNDGNAENCSINLTKDKSPLALHFRDGVAPPGDCVGWGRFSRRACWQAAYRHCVDGRELD